MEDTKEFNGTVLRQFSMRTPALRHGIMGHRFYVSRGRGSWWEVMRYSIWLIARTT